MAEKKMLGNMKHMNPYMLQPQVKSQKMRKWHSNHIQMVNESQNNKANA